MAEPAKPLESREPGATRTRLIALAGNPNVGKTTLFNQLTGLRQKVGNYPGVTVERKVGFFSTPEGERIEVVDVPGTYSLNPKSLDEEIAYRALIGAIQGSRAPDLIVCVVDATNLERNLYLASQVLDLGKPTVIALNMVDAAKAAGLEVDPEKLSRELGVPVIPMVASRGSGLDQLRAVVAGDLPENPERRWELDAPVAQKIDELADILARVEPELTAKERFCEALRVLSTANATAVVRAPHPEFLEAARAARRELEEQGRPYEQAEIIGRYSWLTPLVDRVVRRPEEAQVTLSDRLDAVLTHRVSGPLIFFAILFLIFQAVFAWAVPFMDWIDITIAGFGGWVRTTLPEGPLTNLLVDGVIAGVGAVVIFLPQILILFFFLGLLEDTGYMARAAFIMDRVMRKVGLSGRSVVPLLSGFACAIPGIMATRTIDNERDRLVTILVTPLMTCSARLPVYTLLIGAFIPAGAFLGVIGYQGLTLLALYIMGIGFAVLAAWVLKRWVIRGERSVFVMELPPYRRPRLRDVFWRMIERSKLFLTRAGTVILSISIVLWFLASYPKAELPEQLRERQAQASAAFEGLAAKLVDEYGAPSTEALLEEPGAFGEAWRAATASLDEGGEAQLEMPANEALAADVQALLEHKQAVERVEAEVNDYLEQNQLEASVMGSLGRVIEPLIKPLGYDWKIGVALVASFAAREVAVSALATIYSVQDADESSETLRERIRGDIDPETGMAVFTPLVAVSLMVFFVLACQCMSTVAVVQRETNSWRWPGFLFLYMTALAYVMALITYQGGQLLGFS